MKSIRKVASLLFLGLLISGLQDSVSFQRPEYVVLEDFGDFLNDSAAKLDVGQGLKLATENGGWLTLFRMSSDSYRCSIRTRYMGSTNGIAQSNYSFTWKDIEGAKTLELAPDLRESLENRGVSTGVLYSTSYNITGTPVRCIETVTIFGSGKDELAVMISTAIDYFSEIKEKTVEVCYFQAGIDA